ncbi:hypothetical protein B9Z55_000260 [Caenorhabditis nigoni]|uniref:Uncharacterized protein n=2 Tax=Caenorhabditis nigoni TaxID=1611254 RepID=A0A2G5VL42_9PELO|nr:hypothetical protein B9Z55_000260 [Caenorhabditis nigoni]
MESQMFAEESGVHIPQPPQSQAAVSKFHFFNSKGKIRPNRSPRISPCSPKSIQYAKYEKFYFVAPGGRIKLSTHSTTVSFQFSVQWYSNIPSYNPKFLNISASDSQPSIVDVFFVNSRVTAETRASAITIPLDEDYDRADQIKNLRSVLIFDGPNENATCLGSAYQLLYSNRQWVSTGKFLTIVQLKPLSYTSGSQLLIQDFETTKEINEYQGVGGPGILPIVMDASKQASAFSTYSPYGFAYDCLLNITGTGTLDVYYGGITESKSNLIASYSVSTAAPNLPQLLRGVVRTYVLTGGIATVNIKRYGYFCNHIDKNMNGFITSREYKTNLTLPYSQDSLYYYSKGLFNYTLNLQTVDLSQNKSLQLTITNNKTNVLNVVYNSSNPPMLNTVLSGVGNEMDVFYKADYDSKKGGFYIDFTATKVKASAAKTYGLLVIFAILWAPFF